MNQFLLRKHLSLPLSLIGKSIAGSSKNMSEQFFQKKKKKKNDEFVNFETPHALGDWARPSQKKAMMTQSLYQGNESKEKRKRGGGGGCGWTYMILYSK